MPPPRPASLRVVLPRLLLLILLLPFHTAAFLVRTPHRPLLSSARVRMAAAESGQEGDSAVIHEPASLNPKAEDYSILASKVRNYTHIYIYMYILIDVGSIVCMCVYGWIDIGSIGSLCCICADRDGSQLTSIRYLHINRCWPWTRAGSSLHRPQVRIYLFIY